MMKAFGWLSVAVIVSILSLGTVFGSEPTAIASTTNESELESVSEVETTADMINELLGDFRPPKPWEDGGDKAPVIEGAPLIRAYGVVNHGTVDGWYVIPQMARFEIDMDKAIPTLNVQVAIGVPYTDNIVVISAQRQSSGDTDTTERWVAEIDTRTNPLALVAFILASNERGDSYSHDLPMIHGSIR